MMLSSSLTWMFALSSMIRLSMTSFCRVLFSERALRSFPPLPSKDRSKCDPEAITSICHLW